MIRILTISMVLMSTLGLFSEDMVFSTLDNPPLEMANNGNMQGALTEIVKEAVELTGKSVEFKFEPWARAQYNTEHGNVDACFNAGQNATREKWALFHKEVLFEETYVIFLRKDSTFNISEDFKNVDNLKVGVQRGYTYGGEFQKALDEKRFKQITEAETIEQNLKKLMAGRIDLFIGDKIPSQYFITKENVGDQIKLFKSSTGADFIVSLWPTYVAFSKKTISSSFIDEFDVALKKLKSSGRYDEIINKYLK